MDNRVIIAWIFIALGLIILLNQTNLLDFNAANVIILACCLGGFYLLYRGWKHPDHKGVFGGIFFTILGISLLLMYTNYLPVNDPFAIGIILVDLGISNLIYFIVRRQKISNLTYAFIFILAGSPFIAYEYYYISMWDVENIFSTYWPILLILIGVGLLGEGLLHYYRKNNKQLSKSI